MSLKDLMQAWHELYSSVLAVFHVYYTCALFLSVKVPVLVVELGLAKKLPGEGKNVFFLFFFFAAAQNWVSKLVPGGSRGCWCLH